jgi:sulfur-carrier protein adenylyltransferase/sulfurtransferase
MSPLERANRMPESVGLTRGEALRYSRHIVLPDFGPEGQRRLKGSSVLVVGLGGLGVPAAVYLASAGVGRVGLVDGDVVEASNLQRQFLYSDSDVGRKKADAARERLALINPNVQILPHDTKLTSANALDVLGGYEVVIDATDNLPSRYLINDACVFLHKPDIYASALGFDGQVSVFYPPQGPCYRCLYPDPPPPDSVKSCEDAGVLSVLPGILGGLQASQALSILRGKGSPLIGRLLVFDALGSSFDEVRTKRDYKCRVCGDAPTVRHLIDYEEFCGLKRHEQPPGFNITPRELKAMMDGRQEFLLLDVREPHEYSLVHLRGAELIPLGSLTSKVEALDKTKTIVVYCHVGVRSTAAVSMLRRAGIRAVNLQGGIDAWAEQVDPTLPRY